MFLRHSYKDITIYTKSVYQVAWSCEGTYLGVVSSEKCINISQLSTVKSAYNLQIIHSIPTSSAVSKLAWHPTDDSRLVFCGDDKMVEVWDVRAAKAAVKLPSLGNNLNLAWNNDGSYIVVGNRNDFFVVFDVNTGNQLFKRKFTHEINEMTWSPDSRFIIAAVSTESGGGGIEVLNHDLTSIDTIAAHSSSCLFLTMDPSNMWLAVAAHDKCVTLWSLPDLICRQTFTLELDIVKGMSFSGDGRSLVIVCDDSALLIVDCESGEGLSRVNTRNKCSTVAWHPKRPTLAVGYEDRSAAPHYIRLVSFPDAVSIEEGVGSGR